MRNLFLSLLFVSFCVLVPERDINAQTECPYRVGYLPSLENCSSSWGFYIISDSPIPSGSISLSFPGSTNPGCNQSFTPDGTGVCSNGRTYYVFDNTSPVCSGFLTLGSITFSNGAVCHYEYNEATGHILNITYAECLDFIDDCQESIIDLAYDIVPNSPDCRVWDGACTTENEIWRTGDVGIGSVISPDGYKLSVNGGITTEMLQICKPEWCDYVFADTFKLTPLDQVQEHIKKYGYLPKSTSAKQMADVGGIFVDVEMVNHQEKIEEIFLHLISLENRLASLDERTFPSADGIENISNHFEGAYFEGSLKSKQTNNLIQIECSQIKPAPGGIGMVVVSGYSGVFNLQWAGPTNGNLSNLNCIGGAIRIPDLVAGSYTVSITNSSGLLGTCMFSISNGMLEFCEIFDYKPCEKAILELLENEAFGISPDCIQWEGDPCSHNGNIYRLGNVSIGTNVGKSGYSLAVKGGIVTNKFRVELCERTGWCDYVFYKDYPLLSLREVEKFIEENKHLPGSVTQEQVTREGGFEVRSVVIDHQIKIEEAFLHLIEMNKEKEKLKAKLDQILENN